MKEKNFKIKKCSKKYIYILITSLLFIAKNIVFNLRELSFNTDNNIFGIDLVIRNHILIKLLIEYSGYIIFGAIFTKCFSKDKYKNDSFEKYMLEQQNEKNKKKNMLTLKNSIIKLLLISCIFFATQLMVRSILSFLNVWRLDLWIFNIVFINIFLKKIMNISIYKHQLFILIFIFSINMILIVASSSIKYEGISVYDSVINKFGSAFYIVLFYIIYSSLSALICSSQVIQKKLMDVYYISIFIIIFVIGIINTLFTLIALILATNISCGEGEYLQCSLLYKGYKNDHTFFDNFIIYLYNLSDRHNSDKVSFYLEIFLVYPLYSFLNFTKFLYETTIIMHLDPNYVVLSDIIYYSIKKLISIINNPKDIATYLTLLGEFIALFGYFFYLEIFEIKICGLNQYTKNRISLRGFLETIDNDKILNDNDDDDEEQDIGGYYAYTDCEKKDIKENEYTQKRIEMKNV